MYMRVCVSMAASERMGFIGQNEHCEDITLDSGKLQQTFFINGLMDENNPYLQL